MNTSKYLKETVLILGLILIFISSPLRSISEFRYLSEPLFRLGGILIIIVSIKSLIDGKTSVKDIAKPFTYIYSSFIGLVILSITVNANLETEILNLEKYSLIFIFLCISLSLTHLINKKIIITAFMMSAIIIFTYFLIAYPLSEAVAGTGAYMGGFYNQNSIGVLGSTLFAVSLVTASSLILNRKHYTIATISLFITIGAGYLTIISASRTSFLTIVIISLIITLTFVYNLLKTREILSWKSIVIVLVTGFFGILLFIFIDNPIYTTIESNIINKFTRKLENGSLTAGRVAIWTPIIEGASFFGKGSGYFKELSGLPAHNSFLHILSLYGWLAAIAYFVFWLAMLIKSIFYYVTHKHTQIFALLPLIVIINYLSLSMMENMTTHVSLFLAISMVAVFYKTDKKEVM